MISNNLRGMWAEMADCFQLALTTLETMMLTDDLTAVPDAKDAVMKGWSIFAAAFDTEVRTAAEQQSK